MKLRKRILTVSAVSITVCSMSVGVRAALQEGTPEVEEYLPSLPSPNIPETNIPLQSVANLDQYFQLLRSFLQQELNEILASLDQEIYGVISETTGQMGIPDPVETEEKVYEQAKEASEPGALAVNPTFQAQAATDRARHAIAKAKVQAVFGKQGQEQIEGEVARITEAASGVNQAAATAQSQNITQDVMKQVALQNAQSASILQATHQEAMQTRIATVQSNQALSNIAKNMEQQEWEKTVDSAASAAGLVNTTTQFSALIEAR